MLQQLRHGIKTETTCQTLFPKKTQGAASHHVFINLFINVIKVNIFTLHHPNIRDNVTLLSILFCPFFFSVQVISTGS